jgi:hypothetical protein
MCGRPLSDAPLDYTVRIEVISGEFRIDEDLPDGEEAVREMKRCIELAEGKTEAELMDDVYRRMEFRICPRCQKDYIRDPIPRNFGRNREGDDA